MDSIDLKCVFFLLLNNWKKIVITSFIGAILGVAFHHHSLVYRSELNIKFLKKDDYYPSAVKNKYYNEILIHQNPLDPSYLNTNLKVIANLAAFFLGHDSFQGIDNAKLLKLSNPKWWGDNLSVVYDQLLLNKHKSSLLTIMSPNRKYDYVVEVTINSSEKKLIDSRNSALFSSRFFLDSLIFIESDIYLKSLEALDMEQIENPEKITFISFLNTVHESKNIYEKNPFMLNEVLKDALKSTKSKMTKNKNMDDHTINILSYGLYKIDSSYQKDAILILPIKDIPYRSVYFSVIMGLILGFVFMCALIFSRRLLKQ